MKYVNSIYTPDMSGRQGGAVFSKNKYGVYIKMFKAPSNPRTADQQNIRAFFAACSREWAALTDAQRTDWDSITGTIEYVKKGISYTLTGFNFFVKLNRNLQDIGEPFYQDINRNTLITPDDLNGSSVNVVTTPGNQDIKLNLPAVLDASTKAIVYATQVLKNSRQPNWKQLRAITTIDSTFVNGGSIMTQYLAKFGTMPATGNLVGFCIMPVNTVCGQANSKVYMTAVGTV